MTQISIPGLILNFEQSINQWFPHPPMQNHCLSLFPQNQLLMTYLPNSILAVMPSSLGTFHLSLGSPLPHPLHMPASKSYSHPHPNLLPSLYYTKSMNTTARLCSSPSPCWALLLWAFAQPAVSSSSSTSTLVLFPLSKSCLLSSRPVSTVPRPWSLLSPPTKQGLPALGPLLGNIFSYFSLTLNFLH